MDWKVELGLLWVIKSEAKSFDRDNIYTLHAPESGATQEQIDALQEQLGFVLDTQYTEFLRYVNGWTNFIQNTRLLSTADISGSSLFASICENLAERLPVVSTRYGFEWTVDNCLPIGGSERDLTVFVIERKKTNARIGWLRGEEVDAYDGFEQFFSSMVAYNKLLTEKLRERAKR